MIHSPFFAAYRSALVLVVIGLALFVTGLAHAGINQWTTRRLQGGYIAALILSSLTAATLYAGDWGGGVFKSTGGGASWSKLSRFPSPMVKALALDPLTPTTLYAGITGECPSPGA